jgi:hypothetical protein
MHFRFKDLQSADWLVEAGSGALASACGTSSNGHPGSCANGEGPGVRWTAGIDVWGTRAGRLPHFYNPAPTPANKGLNHQAPWPAP